MKFLTVFRLLGETDTFFPTFSFFVSKGYLDLY